MKVDSAPVAQLCVLPLTFCYKLPTFLINFLVGSDPFLAENYTFFFENDLA